MILRKQKKSKRVNSKNRKEQVSASTQNTIRYRYLFENGLMDIVDGNYSNTYFLTPTTYSTLHEEEQKRILSRYNSVINQLSENEHFQLTILVTKVPKDQYMQELSFPKVEGQSSENIINDLVDELNDIIEQRYDDGRNNFNVERYITLSTSAEDRRVGYRKLENISDTFNDGLNEIQSGIVKLNGMQRLELFNKILRPGKNIYGNFRDIEQSSLTTKDIISPGLIDFDRMSKKDFRIDDNYGEVVYLRDFPRNLSDQIFKELTELEIEMCINIHATSHSIAETNKNLRNEATDIELDIIKREMKASSRGYNSENISRTAKEYQKDINDQIEFVSETGDKQQSSTFMIYTWSDSESVLQSNIKKIEALGDKWGAVFEPFYLTQEYALNSTLPIGKNFMDFERIYLRNLITPNISINSPFTSVDIQQKDGKYYGINELSKNNIVINRKGKELLNGNGGIMSVSGGGKSFAAKTEMITTFIKRPNDEIIIVDAEQEYGEIAKILGGEVIKIAPGTSTSINVMEIPNSSDLDLQDNPYALKSDFLVSLFGNLLGGITPSQRSIIDQTTIETYKKCQKPTLQDWYFILKNDDRLSAKELAEALDIYITGSLNMFANKTNVSEENRVTVYDMHSLKNEMAAFGYMVILDRIWQSVVSNKKKGKTTWVYFDEFQIIMNPAQLEQIRVQAADIYARIRKYNGIPTFMTQSAETMLSTFEGRSIMFNSSFLILLEQQGEVYENLVKRFRLTERQSSYLLNPGVGKGLIVAGGEVIPFSNKIPEGTKLFKIMDTKPSDKY